MDKEAYPMKTSKTSTQGSPGMIASTSVDWLNMNIDMLEMVANKISSLGDYVRFRAVCFRWRSSLPNKPKPSEQQQPFPCLLIPSIKKSNVLPSHLPRLSLCLLNPLNGEVVDRLEHLLPQRDADSNLSFIGFSKGWLAVLSRDSPSMYLINPFTATMEGDADCNPRVRPLPPRNTFPCVLGCLRPDNGGKEYLVHKVMLSAPPTDDNCIAMAIYDLYQQLAYCRHGDKQWTRVDTPSARFSDIVFCKDRFYVVSYAGSVFVISDLDASPLTAVEFFSPQVPKLMQKVYLVLVESLSSSSSYCHENHRLLLVSRKLDLRKEDDSYETLMFEIFTIDLDLNPTKTKKLEILDDHVLFLGCNDSISHPSCNLPGGRRKGGCIYFTSDGYLKHHKQGKIGQGVYHGLFIIEDKTVEPLLGYHQLIFPRPIWVLHNPC